MEKLKNALDLRNNKIKVNGEEFMALPVALNENFSWWCANGSTLVN